MSPKNIQGILELHKKRLESLKRRQIATAANEHLIQTNLAIAYVDTLLAKLKHERVIQAAISTIEDDLKRSNPQAAPASWEDVFTNGGTHPQSISSYDSEFLTAHLLFLQQVEDLVEKPRLGEVRLDEVRIAAYKQLGLAHLQSTTIPWTHDQKEVALKLSSAEMRHEVETILKRHRERLINLPVLNDEKDLDCLVQASFDFTTALLEKMKPNSNQTSTVPFSNEIKNQYWGDVFKNKDMTLPKIDSPHSIDYITAHLTFLCEINALKLKFGVEVLDLCGIAPDCRNLLECATSQNNLIDNACKAIVASFITIEDSKQADNLDINSEAHLGVQREFERTSLGRFAAVFKFESKLGDCSKEIDRVEAERKELERIEIERKHLLIRSLPDLKKKLSSENLKVLKKFLDLEDCIAETLFQREIALLDDGTELLPETDEYYKKRFRYLFKWRRSFDVKEIDTLKKELEKKELEKGEEFKELASWRQALALDRSKDEPGARKLRERITQEITRFEAENPLIEQIREMIKYTLQRSHSEVQRLMRQKSGAFNPHSDKDLDYKNDLACEQERLQKLVVNISPVTELTFIETVAKTGILTLAQVEAVQKEAQEQLTILNTLQAELAPASAAAQVDEPSQDYAALALDPQSIKTRAASANLPRLKHWVRKHPLWFLLGITLTVGMGIGFGFAYSIGYWFITPAIYLVGSAIAVGLSGKLQRPTWLPAWLRLPRWLEIPTVEYSEWFSRQLFNNPTSPFRSVRPRGWFFGILLIAAAVIVGVFAPQILLVLSTFAASNPFIFKLLATDILILGVGLPALAPLYNEETKWLSWRTAGKIMFVLLVLGACAAIGWLATPIFLAVFQLSLIHPIAAHVLATCVFLTFATPLVAGLARIYERVRNYFRDTEERVGYVPVKPALVVETFDATNEPTSIREVLSLHLKRLNNLANKYRIGDNAPGLAQIIRAIAYVKGLFENTNELFSLSSYNPASVMPGPLTSWQTIFTQSIASDADFLTAHLTFLQQAQSLVQPFQLEEVRHDAYQRMGLSYLDPRRSAPGLFDDQKLIEKKLEELELLEAKAILPHSVIDDEKLHYADENIDRSYHVRLKAAIAYRKNPNTQSIQNMLATISDITSGEAGRLHTEIKDEKFALVMANNVRKRIKEERKLISIIEKTAQDDAHELLGKSRATLARLQYLLDPREAAALVMACSLPDIRSASDFISKTDLSKQTSQFILDILQTAKAEIRRLIQEQQLRKHRFPAWGIALARTEMQLELLLTPQEKGSKKLIDLALDSQVLNKTQAEAAKKETKELLGLLNHLKSTTATQAKISSIELANYLKIAVDAASLQDFVVTPVPKSNRWFRKHPLLLLLGIALTVGVGFAIGVTTFPALWLNMLCWCIMPVVYTFVTAIAIKLSQKDWLPTVKYSEWFSRNLFNNPGSPPQKSGAFNGTLFGILLVTAAIFIGIFAPQIFPVIISFATQNAVTFQLLTGAILTFGVAFPAMAPLYESGQKWSAGKIIFGLLLVGAAIAIAWFAPPLLILAFKLSIPHVLATHMFSASLFVTIATPLFALAGKGWEWLRNHCCWKGQDKAGFVPLGDSDIDSSIGTMSENGSTVEAKNAFNNWNKSSCSNNLTSISHGTTFGSTGNPLVSQLSFSKTQETLPHIPSL